MNGQPVYTCPCGWSRIVLDGESVADAKRAHEGTAIHAIAKRGAEDQPDEYGYHDLQIFGEWTMAYMTHEQADELNDIALAMGVPVHASCTKPEFQWTWPSDVDGVSILDELLNWYDPVAYPIEED